MPTLGGASAFVASFDEHREARGQRCGPRALSDAELVALLTHPRLRNAGDLTAARSLVRDGLPALLRRVDAGASGIRPAHAIRLAAALEIVRRALYIDVATLPAYDTDAVGRMLAGQYGLHVQEHVGAILLDARDRIIAQRLIFVGTLQAAFVSTRDVVRVALDMHAAKLVLFHNHPSGDTQASSEDVLFTLRLRDALKLFDVTLEDHLIVARGRYVSLRSRGHL